MKNGLVADNDGTKEWYQNDKLHREDGPAVEFKNGTKWWVQHGRRHRLDGPAIEFTNGTKYWYQNGKRHRTDGPAVEYADGSVEYWVDDRQLTENKWHNYRLTQWINYEKRISS